MMDAGFFGKMVVINCTNRGPSGLCEESTLTLPGANLQPCLTRILPLDHTSVHKNVLKVLGCCLETQQQAVVYEFGGSKDLCTCISAINVEPLPWKCRLKIATDLANAAAHLHTAFRRPVIHRDIKSSNVILDQNNVLKLIDFGLCICISQGQLHVDDAVFGRSGYSAPEYIARGYLTEKVDVHMFGMLLLELLTGRKPFCLQDHIRWSG